MFLCILTPVLVAKGDVFKHVCVLRLSVSKISPTLRKQSVGGQLISLRRGLNSRWLPEQISINKHKNGSILQIFPGVKYIFTKGYMGVMVALKGSVVINFKRIIYLSSSCRPHKLSVRVTFSLEALSLTHVLEGFVQKRF